MRLRPDDYGFVYYNEFLMHLYRFYMDRNLHIYKPRPGQEQYFHEAQELIRDKEKKTHARLAQIKKQ
jgi:hypothetical protein